jgi:hypothetical protein
MFAAAAGSARGSEGAQGIARPSARVGCPEMPVIVRGLWGKPGPFRSCGARKSPEMPVNARLREAGHGLSLSCIRRMAEGAPVYKC